MLRLTTSAWETSESSSSDSSKPSSSDFSELGTSDPGTVRSADDARLVVSEPQGLSAGFPGGGDSTKLGADPALELEARDDVGLRAT